MIMLKKRNLIFLLIIAVLVGGLVGGAVFYGVNQNINGESITVSKKEYAYLEAMSEKYSKLESIWQYADKNYYVPVDEKNLEIGMYKGLLAGIGDPYSGYLTADEYEQLMVSSVGEYNGIGVTLAGGTDGYITVVSPVDGSPAYNAGLKSGDKILTIDNKKYDNSSLDVAAKVLRGEPGSKVKIGILRGEKNMNIEIVRTKIILKTVSSKLIDNNIGYIRISSFEANTAKDFETELRNFEVKGVKGVIIDLRDNGGGIVDSGADIADMLLPAGLITYAEDRKGDKKTWKSDAVCTELPYVVLVNGGTASTSEIVAAAIKDYKAGKIIGTKTFGKGIIQVVEKLKDGDAIKMTVMQYFSPNGKIIHKKGIKPDINVELLDDNGGDEQLNKALEILKK